VVTAEGRIVRDHVEAAQAPVRVPSEIRERPSAVEVLRDALAAAARDSTSPLA